MRITKFWTVSVLAALVLVAGAAYAVQAPNPRTGTTTVAPQRAEGREVKRNGAASVSGTSSQNTVSRSATRRPTATASRSGTNQSISARSAARQTVVSSPRANATVSRAATSGAARSANPYSSSGASAARSSARSATVSGVSRAATARATAVFDDVSKIGGGYATCRDAYSTCMDQFCAKANDTYRRCFCSSKYTEFRDTENALDQAKTLLMQFEDNNLNAVDKTASEVNAMYTATVGEQAIKNDTSGAAATLAEIGDLLSGKKKATTTNTSSSTSLGVLDLDFSVDVDDIWSGGGSSSGSIFATDNGVDLSQLEGQALYNQANKQCLSLITESCENDAVLTMAKSSYNILISQDCNTYEKRINSQKEAVQQTVRTAEKYLREARLEEYRAHNSADVNECVAKVKNAMTTDVACGANYNRCLDYSGVYINPSTGDPVYSQRLFQLADLILLDGSADILGQNAEFNSFLDSKRMYAATALDTCRDQADIVWEEFKRSALIEIAQAQDAKIEEVKMSCVSTMKECYDEQSGALKSFDDTTAQAAGALSVYAAKEMCQDKVIACASLYGNTDGCKFDGNGRLTAANGVSALNGNGTCGLTSLLTFVDSVDSVRVAEGCATAIDNYVQQLCTPTTGNMGFPWNCRLKIAGNVMDDPSGKADASVAANIKQFAIDNCSNPNATEKTFDILPVQTRTQVEKAVSDVLEQLDYQMMEMCESLDGYWVDSDDNEGKPLAAFYANAFGGDTSNTSLGRCVENTTMIRCLDYNDTDKAAVATYDRTKDECSFTDEWYKTQCSLLGSGYYENGVCYVAP